ncbi:DNA integrity scanning protein DisA nucleotide-binding domain protein [Planctomyces sp. SH-PL14]|uniref:DNA integrity scanning protein DisA nucleotide-binding domain protein n=1 Tax=Planctomyces sp. SH-PL14 TaxID=1632864 RepID=UPI00078EC406|nr:diadenylate cyclase [Planctomyces sp. SH-PL14]AMV17765.1 DNA integrity scanning protein DisA [Planctomyces sp. SH-PL14]
MVRSDLTPQLSALLAGASKLADSIEAAAVLVLAEHVYDFRAIRATFEKRPVIIASNKQEIVEAAKKEGLSEVLLSHEPQTRQIQVSQALLEAIADDLLPTGAKVVAVYTSFDKDALDTVSIISLTERLARLTRRDLQRLETSVPLDTLRRVVDLAVEIGREGREGHAVGTLFVVGQHRKVLEMSHEGVHDPFRGYSAKERMIHNPRVRESIKELAQIDGAFVISSDGQVVSAGRILDANAESITLSKGLGARHWAAAGISKAARAIAIAVSESTGTVRIFQDGVVVLRIEPLDQAMKWHEVATEPPLD